MSTIAGVASAVSLLVSDDSGYVYAAYAAAFVVLPPIHAVSAAAAAAITDVPVTAVVPGAVFMRVLF